MMEVNPNNLNDVGGQQQVEEHTNNNERMRRIMKTIPWTKFIIVILLLFISAMLQVTVWTLENARSQKLVAIHKKSQNQKRFKEYTQQQTDNIDRKNDNGKGSTTTNDSEDITTSSSSENDTKSSKEGMQETTNDNTNEPKSIRGIHPTDYDTIHWNRIKSSTTTTTTTTTGTSIETSAIAYWNQFIQSGLLNWECYDSIPSVGISSLNTFHMTQYHCQLLNTKRKLLQQQKSSSVNSNNQNLGSLSFSKKFIHYFLKFLTTGTIVFPITKTATTISNNNNNKDTGSNDDTTDEMNQQQQQSIQSSNNNKLKTKTKIKRKERIQYALFALQKAAELGHPDAQLLLANSLSAGYYPFRIGNGQQQQQSKQSTRKMSLSASSASSKLFDNIHLQYPEYFVRSANLSLSTSSSSSSHTTNNGHTVSEDWLLHSKNPIHKKAMLLWHMAAQHGNVEAAITLGNRILADQRANPPKLDTTTTATNSKSPPLAAATVLEEQMCRVRLPYYSAAAHGIIDQLQSSDQSRAIVLPANDKRILYKIHILGSTPSRIVQQNPHNQPDERQETINYYKMTASTIVDDNFNIDTVTDANAKTIEEAKEAAHRLGLYYRMGYKGVMQNLKLATKYYSAAAKAGDREAAGYAGTFYFWGIGVEQNYTMSYNMYKYGTPYGYQGCREQYERFIIQTHVKYVKERTPKQLYGMNTSILDEKISLCDSDALNGMGLLRLFRVHPDKHLVSIDENEQIAIKLFQLAQAQQNADASYNLAMIRLGYKSHFKSIHDISTSKTTTIVNDDEYLLLKHDNTANDFVSKGSNKDANDDSSLTSTSQTVGVSSFDKKSQHFPTAKEYTSLLADLTTASNEAHILATHRLGMIYENGIQIPSSTNVKGKRNVNTLQTIVAKDCLKAESNYKRIIEYGSPQINARMRLAYKLYMSGNTADSLRHYLAVAELGYSTAQINAAFLLEQGECLNGLLSSSQCSSASVRLWKAVAANGNDPEASIRVGDYYYYGKFRHEQHKQKQQQERDQQTSKEQHRLLSSTSSSSMTTNGRRPFQWIQHILFPEEYLLPYLYGSGINFIDKIVKTLSSSSTSKQSNKRHSFEYQSRYSFVCTESTDDRTQPQCTNRMEDEYDSMKNDISLNTLIEQDLINAARYYKLAVNQATSSRFFSPRAQYNIGFMYEWGLGLKQDFPLAKRHYDLAVEAAKALHEATLPAVLALRALTLHEYIVKQQLVWTNRIERWQEQIQQRLQTVPVTDTVNDIDDVTNEQIRTNDDTRFDLRPAMFHADQQPAHTTRTSTTKGSMQSMSGGRKLPPLHDDMIIQTGNPVYDIILYHILSWETLVIFMLTIAVTVLVQMRYAQQQLRR